jgi:hypothetical protein
MRAPGYNDSQDAGQGVESYWILSLESRNKYCVPGIAGIDKQE